MRHDNRNNKKPEHFQQTLQGILKKNNFENAFSLINTESPRDFVNVSKQIMDRSAKFLTSSQLRNIYDKVITTSSADQLQYLRPKVAYMAARQGSTEAKGFVLFLDEIINEVNSQGDHKRFLQFFEALVAYHKFYNSKNE